MKVSIRCERKKWADKQLRKFGKKMPTHLGVVTDHCEWCGEKIYVSGDSRNDKSQLPGAEYVCGDCLDPVLDKHVEAGGSLLVKPPDFDEERFRKWSMGE